MTGEREWAVRPQDNMWANWQQQPPWTPTVYPPPWPNSPIKGKGKSPNKTNLWCDIHQAYGYSTDWCFDNPNKSGGPPKQEWCENHQNYGHSTAHCRKGKGQPHKGSKDGKGKSKSPNRAWKSDNFPANYDQATPAMVAPVSPDKQPNEW